MGLSIKRGVTRTVVLTKRWAFKLPGGLGHAWLRGWLANRSEWRQRNRPDVARPRLTLCHLVVVFPRAIHTGSDRLDPIEQELPLWTQDGRYSAEEAKPSSWGAFDCPCGCGYLRWMLVDFDRAWQQDSRGLVGSLYFGRQERMARKWMTRPLLPPLDEEN